MFCFDHIFSLVDNYCRFKLNSSKVVSWYLSNSLRSFAFLHPSPRAWGWKDIPSWITPNNPDGITIFIIQIYMILLRPQSWKIFTFISFLLHRSIPMILPFSLFKVFSFPLADKKGNFFKLFFDFTLFSASGYLLYCWHPLEPYFILSNPVLICCRTFGVKLLIF